VADPEPVLRVVRGTPTPEELAALVLVFTLRRGPRSGAPGPGASTSGAAGPSPWVLSARPGTAAGDLPAARGPRAWRASAYPRGGGSR
jgi:hypothetical protein